MTRGLLNRLADGRRASDELTEVLEHIRVLLNTTKGDSLTVPHY
jgi:hypothetical protein